MDTSHFSPGRSPAEPTPIVGRSAEQVLLYEQLAGVAQGQGRVCLISGEAGIGKSTLVRDVVRQARELGFRVLSGQCHDLMASPPYGLWLDLVQRYRMDHEGEDVVVPEPFADGRVGDVRDQNEVFSKMWTFLAGIARGTTTVVTLEDVHWADPVSIELIRFLASHLDHLPVCLVLTYRVDELTRQNPVYRAIPMLLRESGGIRIDLAGLRLPDLAMLVAIRYGLPSDDCSRLAACLLRYSEGNPFFALELLHTLEQAGEERGLHWSGTGWRLGALNSVAIPGLVRQVIELRVERLDPDVVEALVLAAVIGQGVPLELWQRLLGVDDGRMLHVIEDALDAHILDADATGDHVYFVHALTRETLYEHVLPSRRRAMHLDIANALLETEHPDSESVAYHLERAGDPRAADWMIFAGERAQRAYAWLAARDRFASAAQSLIDVPGEELRRARLLYRCGRLLRYADAPQGLEDIRLAQRLAEQVGSRMLAAEAEYSRGLLHCFADSWVRGLEEMTAGIDRIEALPLDQSRETWASVDWIADALPAANSTSEVGIDRAAERFARIGVSHRRGGLPWFLATVGRLREAADVAELFPGCLDRSDAGPLFVAATGHARFGSGMVHVACGDPSAAHEAFDAARDHYRRIDHHAVLGFVDLTELLDLTLRYETDDLFRRRGLADDAQASLDRAGGSLPPAMSMRRMQLPVFLIEGRWREARAIVEDCEEHGNYMLRRPVTFAMAEIALHQGRDDAVRHYVREILPAGSRAAPGSAVLQDALRFQCIAIELKLRDGNTGAARSWLEAQARWLDWSGAVAGVAEHLLLAGRIAQAEGNLDAASVFADEAVLAAREPRQPWALLRALRFRGAVATDLKAAERDFSESLNLADACNAPFERASTLVESARRGIRPAGIDDPYEVARGIAETLDARPLLDTIEHLAGPMVAQILSARELEVLRLVARGMTDAEIGEQLFISPRTASQHLRSIYRKLDLHSRAGATRYALDRGIV